MSDSNIEKIEVKDTNTSLSKVSPVDVIIVILISLLCLTCILPFMHIIAKSLSSYRAVISNEVVFWPIEITISNYMRVLDSSSMLNQMWYTIWVTVLTTVIGLVVNAFTAYPL